MQTVLNSGSVLALEKTGIAEEITGSCCDGCLRRRVLPAQVKGGNDVGGPGTSDRERASSGSPVRLSHRLARAAGRICQRTITKLSFSCYMKRHTVTAAQARVV